ncbi:MAG: reverse transcriptase N-terminal domain-containing protein [Nostoc sp.]|uniref:reverse transcriptase N-terminal domain-containing protein n=1 Tax=Nostoc sp. TaxID=1180 RepID=UPI002FF92FE8
MNRNVEKLEVLVAMYKPNSDSEMKTEGWKSIDWRKAEKYVFKLQKRIYAASRRGDVKRCRKLQRTLMSSWSNRVIAVRRVTVENQGKQLFPTSDSEAGARTRATGTPQGGVITPPTILQTF